MTDRSRPTPRPNSPPSHRGGRGAGRGAGSGKRRGAGSAEGRGASRHGPGRPPGRHGGGTGTPEKRGRWSRVPLWLRRVLLFGPLALVLLAGIVYIQTDVPRPEQLGIAQTTVVLYADGVEEVGRVGPENRTQVALSAVPLPVQQAVLSAENREYYSEPGVSLTGIGRALITNVRGGEVQQGGSTITQQYAKIAILQDSSRTYLRKVRELFVAVKLDQTYSKDQILEWYLNTVYFGRGAYGVQAAAETYFGKDIADLTVQEGAVLAALIASPGNNDPATSPEAAQERFDYVLDGMVAEGWLSQADRADMSLPEVLPAERPNRLEGQAGYLVREVEVELERRGFTEDQINRGGLRVTTTIDKRAQDAAVEAIDDVLPRRDADLLPSLAAIEPGTGRVKALYGGPDYVVRQLNSATQGRAPAGSAFKPFVLATALEQGWSLRSRYDGNSPGSFGGGYSPRNAGGQDYGRIDLVTATQESVNTAYVGLADDLELQTVADTARAAGIESEVPADQGLSIALGGPVFVTPLEMAEAYATFAARGTHADSFVVERVEAPNGSVLYQADPRTDQAFSTDTADDATYAMERVVTSGTGTRARLRDGRDVAGKTGTATDEDGDTLAVWFAGYTPQLAVSVAVFREGNQPIDGIADSVSGGRIPAAIFKAFADAALEDTDRLSFEPPVFGGSNRGGEVASREPDSDDDETSTPRPRSTSPTSRPSSPRPSPRAPRTSTAEPERESETQQQQQEQEQPEQQPEQQQEQQEPSAPSSGQGSGGQEQGRGSEGQGSEGQGSEGQGSGGQEQGQGSEGQSSGQGQRSGQSERDSGG